MTLLLLAAALPALPLAARPVDYLIRDVPRRAALYQGASPNEIVLDNGLIRRTFRLSPNCASVAFDNLMTGDSLLRSVRPEASLTLNDRPYDIGGLAGQPEHAYLRREWLDQLKADPAAFRCAGYETGVTKARFPWKRVRYSANLPWPPPGVSLTFRFDPPPDGPRGVAILVHYELYDGVPVLSKWIELRNDSAQPAELKTFTAEILAAVEGDSQVESAVASAGNPYIQIETDYSFVATHPSSSATRLARWGPDKRYTTQVNYRLEAPVLLEVSPPAGPGLAIAPGSRFESFRVFELIHDSTERERRGLALRRFYRTVAPYATENPILMHVRRATPDAVKLAIDQCAAVGFEMVIMTFGSGFNIEREEPAYRDQIRQLVEYGKQKGVELGGYSLLASRKISPEDDALHPDTGKPGGAIFGNSPCLGSRWGIEYFRKLTGFIEATGIALLEHDGSYPGDFCASTSHPGHRGLDDSQWRQWRQISSFYQWCRARGVYLNVPDWYFLSGSNKSAMGYREVNWSLPRERQFLLGRQNIFDGTWDKTPSMGWMFVPLVEYHGGGAAATLEPLDEHLDAYEQHLAQNFSSGVQACYRGPRLYDTDRTRAVVKKWVDFYKAHRPILDADIIHVRRPDGRDFDAILHVNPRLKEKGLAVIHNPLNEPIERTVRLPLYYTGLTQKARVRTSSGRLSTFTLNRDYSIDVPVSLPARGLAWLLIE